MVGLGDIVRYWTAITLLRSQINVPHGYFHVNLKQETLGFEHSLNCA